MPRVSRSRLIAADPERVWELVSDPHSLPRWWPRTARVEDVRRETAAARSGRACSRPSAARGAGRLSLHQLGRAGERYAWEQEIEGTPFERVLRSARLEIGLRPGRRGHRGDPDGGARRCAASRGSARR